MPKKRRTQPGDHPHRAVILALREAYRQGSHRGELEWCSDLMRAIGVLGADGKGEIERDERREGKV